MILKKIILNNKGELTPQDLAFFGGKYGLLERFKMAGIGSSKVFYKHGVPYFDELGKFAENEISFANFELMKNGLLIRLNRTQKLRIIGFQLQEILTVKVAKVFSENQEDNKQLKIFTSDEKVILFEVSNQNFKNILRFFQKPPFQEKLDIDYESE